MNKKNYWQRVCIKDVCESIIDCVNKTAPTVDYPTPYKMIRTTNVKDGWINLSVVKYVTEEVYKKWTRRAKPEKGDVILTREAPLGEVGMLRVNDTIFLGQRLIQYRANPKKLDNRFLLYAFQSNDLQGQIKSFGSGATVEHMRVPDCEKLTLLTPPLPTQKKIAGILSAYDDLIENNTRRIKILEEMAQTLYHEWFVKFRFPGHEHTKMVDSELGLIPEGWEVKRIKDLPIQIIDGDRSKKYPKASEFQKEGILFLNTKNIVDNKLDFSEANFITLEKFSQINKGRLQPLDIVMTTRGSIGKITLFNCKYLTGLINAQMLILRADNQYFYQLFLFYLMCSHDFQESIKGFSSGSAQPQIPIQDLKEIEIICPPVKLQIQFSNFAYNINQLIKNLQHKNETLRQTRDLLLPKLISGEIDVEHLEITAEDIAA